MREAHLQELLHAHIRSTILLEDVHVRCITIIITMNLLATSGSGVSFSLHPSQCGGVHGCMALYVSLI